MSISSEKKRFEERFEKDEIEIAVVTGAYGIGSGKAGRDILWTSSIDIVAWKDLNEDQSIREEEIRLEWLVDEEERIKTGNILTGNSIARIKVRKGERSIMLLSVLESEYKDQDLETVLEESLKPVFYNDDILGKFEMDKGIKTFGKEISWLEEDGELYFDWDEDENIMKRSLETAHNLFKDQAGWNDRIRKYACDKMLELANDWLEDNEEATVDRITSEMFMNLMEFESLNVHDDGSFDFYFSDGDMFWGHCIIVEGNINGEFESAYIAG